MCGIVGIVGARAESRADTIEIMKRSIGHRGPDGHGTTTLSGCAFGHVRLSIIDIAGGAQPMLSPSGAEAVTFNGEIYNFLELRAALDYPFRTRSDTEVLLALHEREGDALPERLAGMFAFALWDEGRRRLFCARDRFGEKPFFYARGREGDFVFASELKAIVASGLVDLRLDRASLAHYLQRLYVPPGRTIYEGVHALPPAHRLVLEAGAIRVEPYWRLPAERDMGLAEATERFRVLFDEAVERQLIADVETGAFLSGGLDSSSIVAVAARHVKRLKTFSFGFEGDRSELPFAAEVARLHGTEHHEFVDEELPLAELFLHMQEVYDEPFADSSNLPTWALARHAARHVKVALSGDGGDELLGGYVTWYRPLWHMERGGLLRAFASFAARAAAKLRRMMGRGAPAVQDHFLLGRHLRRTGASVAEARARMGIYFGDEELRAMGLDAPVPPGAPDGGNGSLNDAMRMDLVDYLPGDILVKVDRASMAHGLEVRAPFLDPELASFCIGLPARLKIDGTTDKKILREAMAPLWPPSVRRRGKQGFGAPVDRWLRRPDMVALRREFLDDPSKRIHAVLGSDAIRRHGAGEDYRTWILLVLSAWMEIHGFDHR